LDEYETVGCFKDIDAPFIWEYFGGAVLGKLDVVDHLANYDYWSMRGGHGPMNSAVSYLLRHRILDILVDVMCGDSRAMSKPVATMPQVSLNARVSKVRESLADWTDGVAKFASLMKGHKGKERATLMPPPQSAVLPSIQRQLLQSGLGILISANHHLAESKLNKCLVNVELAAFALSWFAMVGLSTFCCWGYSFYAVIAQGEMSLPNLTGIFRARVDQ
jgi:hypothetical protein